MATDTDQTIAAPRVLLTGASSQIGVFAIPRLVEAGFHVLAISRSGKPASFPDFGPVDWLTEREAVQASIRYQYLLSAGPMEVARRYLAGNGQLDAAVVFSSSSVESKQDSADPGEREQIQGMLALESELMQSARSRGVRLVILRPTLIYGCGLDTNISRLAGWARRFGFIPINTNASGLRQPVHADDLAAVAIKAMLSEAQLPPVLPLAGGETLSYAEMAARIFKAYGRPARLLRLPEKLFVLLVNTVKLFRPGSGINGEMVRRQRVDLVFDDHQARELLGYKPRAFEPGVEDFALPQLRDDRQAG
jgi:nucleoside-diphosphate-sugar epimerase